MATVRELLTEGQARLLASGSESARLDTELLLAHALDTERTTILAHPEAPVGETAADRYRAALARREGGEPVAYIRGFKEFHGLAFGVDERALIPRPETERLVDLAEAEIVRRLIGAPRPAGSPRLRIIDVGVGCGAVAIAVAVALRRRNMLDEVELTATDVSADAIALATENAVAHAVADAIRLREAELLPGWEVRRWDLVLANLPYVRTSAIADLPRAATFEPRLALDGGPDGLAVIGRLVDLLPTALEADGAAMVEIGGDQEAELRSLVAERLPSWSCSVERDLGGLPRVAVLAPA
ncbi:MAG TPA: peptide chain release factor N(5)-glutamine methyltransferase [Candidatus Deferrimicrobiaceae bacterium]|nr:peptide chain release factor N(5)-glutamine methyltransferase [Candidatus Deferrimicrobiaceae bacterium]